LADQGHAHYDNGGCVMKHSYVEPYIPVISGILTVLSGMGNGENLYVNRAKRDSSINSACTDD
jgi:hypothetical protein